jgi:hypothetical protein
VEGDVAGDGGGVLRRGAGRRLDLVRRAHGGVVGNSLGVGEVVIRLRSSRTE